MAFLDNQGIVITQKDNGMVRLVSNGILQQQPILQVPVLNNSERGLLGVAIANTTSNSTAKTVFLYYTEPVGNQARNRIYRYEWDGMSNLSGGRLILDLPGEPGPNHDGGKMQIGPDGMLYAVVGDLNRRGMLENILDGPAPDDTSVIFRIKPDGSAVDGNPFFNSTKDYGNIGVVLQDLGNYDQALRSYNKSLAINEELQDRVGMAKDYTHIGNVLYSQGNYDQALEYLNKSLAINEELQDRVGMAKDYGNIGNIGVVFANINKNKAAIKSFSKGLEIFKELEKNTGYHHPLDDTMQVYISDLQKQEVG
jgi:hypothetical protein